MKLEPWGPVHRVDFQKKYRANLLDLVVMHAECGSCKKSLPDLTIRTIASVDYRSPSEMVERSKRMIAAMKGEKLTCTCGKKVGAACVSYHAYHSGREADLVARFEYGLFGVSGPQFYWWTNDTGYRPAELTADDHRVFARDAAVRAIAVVRETQGIEAAFPAIEAALTEIPGDPALMELLHRLLAVGKNSLAGKIIDAHRKLHPEDPDGHAWDGELSFRLINAKLWEQDALPEAEASLQKALSLKPDHFGALLTLASIARMRGDEPAAIATYERLMKADPTSDLPHYNLAAIFLEKDPARALKHFELGERAAPTDPDYAIGCARALVRLGRHDEAKKALDRGAQMAPDHPRIAEVRAALGN
jgi:tetratricopeptide (TPR) repeat protein